MAMGQAGVGESVAERLLQLAAEDPPAAAPEAFVTQRATAHEDIFVLVGEIRPGEVGQVPGVVGPPGSFFALAGFGGWIRGSHWDVSKLGSGSRLE